MLQPLDPNKCLNLVTHIDSPKGRPLLSYRATQALLEGTIVSPWRVGVALKESRGRPLGEQGLPCSNVGVVQQESLGGVSIFRHLFWFRKAGLTSVFCLKAGDQDSVTQCQSPSAFKDFNICIHTKLLMFDVNTGIYNPTICQWTNQSFYGIFELHK